MNKEEQENPFAKQSKWRQRVEELLNKEPQNHILIPISTIQEVINRIEYLKVDYAASETFGAYKNEILENVLSIIRSKIKGV